MTKEVDFITPLQEADSSTDVAEETAEVVTAKEMPVEPAGTAWM